MQGKLIGLAVAATLLTLPSASLAGPPNLDLRDAPAPARGNLELFDRAVERGARAGRPRLRPRPRRDVRPDAADVANLRLVARSVEPGRHHPPPLQPGARRDRVLRLAGSTPT